MSHVNENLLSWQKSQAVSGDVASQMIPPGNSCLATKNILNEVVSNVVHVAKLKAVNPNVVVTTDVNEYRSAGLMLKIVRVVPLKHYD